MRFVTGNTAKLSFNGRFTTRYKSQTIFSIALHNMIHIHTCTGLHVLES